MEDLKKASDFYSVGDKVSTVDCGTRVFGRIVRVKDRPNILYIDWPDIIDPCEHHEDEFDEIRNEDKIKQWDK